MGLIREQLASKWQQRALHRCLLFASAGYRKKNGLPLTAPFLDMFREYHGPEQVTAKGRCCCNQ
jgi:hypothetical protein